MSHHPTPSSAQDIADFKEAFGNSMVAVMALRAARSGDVEYALSGYGLHAVPEGASYTVKVDAVEPYVGGGVKFSDLSAAAKNRLLAREMQVTRRMAYRWFTDQAYNGIKLDEIVSRLEALDLPVPGTQTVVTGTIYREGKPTSVGVRVSGKMTSDEARAALSEIGEDHPQAALARAAFGDRVVESSLPGKTSSVRATQEPVWPPETEITVEGADSE